MAVSSTPGLSPVPTSVQVRDLDHHSGLPSWSPPRTCDNIRGRALGGKCTAVLGGLDTVGPLFGSCKNFRLPGFSEPQFPSLQNGYYSSFLATKFL